MCSSQLSSHPPIGIIIVINTQPIPRSPKATIEKNIKIFFFDWKLRASNNDKRAT
jgi:hypothetical protein